MTTKMRSRSKHLMQRDEARAALEKRNAEWNDATAEMRARLERVTHERDQLVAEAQDHNALLEHNKDLRKALEETQAKLDAALCAVDTLTASVADAADDANALRSAREALLDQYNAKVKALEAALARFNAEGGEKAFAKMRERLRAKSAELELSNRALTQARSWLLKPRVLNVLRAVVEQQAALDEQLAAAEADAKLVSKFDPPAAVTP